MGYQPPTEYHREEIVRISKAFLDRPEIPYRSYEDLIHIRSLELDWEIGCKVYEPEDSHAVPRGADGKKAGIFLLHGGAGDHRNMEPLAALIVRKLGYRVVAMTYPGKLYLHDGSRDWPGDTVYPDGTARTPIWHRDEQITPDQYELVSDRTDPAKRAKWGTLFFLRAKEDTAFYHRMAAWPAAFEEGMKAVCARHFPEDEWSVYIHGHSTGGPFCHMVLQRVPNIAGLIGAETSPFGFLFGRMIGMTWDVPFTHLTLRTWRHIAKYAGSEAGPEGIWRLPWIMEDALDAWEKAKRQPQFKAEYFVTYAALDGLAAAARAAAKRLGLNAGETEQLVARYQGYTRELSGPGVKPLPPLLYGIMKGSRDHTAKRYREVILPALAAMNPAPRTHLVSYHAGVHGYMLAEPDLPTGVGPAVVQTWHEAITGGFFL